MSPRANDVVAEATMMQAYVELSAQDPEAISAYMIAHTRLTAARRLLALRRVRVFELAGALPGGHDVAALLYRSSRFYNPAKERCVLRAHETEPAPFRAEEALVLVTDRGLERRAAAERWWRHETGSRIEVREGTVWALMFEPGENATAQAASLAAVVTRAEGLLSNPHYQDWRPGQGASPPWPWLERARRARKGDTS